jgi:aminoglycoside 6'-N-acetyltransferase I
MGNPTIRETQPEDRNQLVEMRLLLQNHLETSNPGIWHMTEQGKQEIGQDIDQMLSDEDGRVMIAEEDESITGYAYGHVSHRTTLTPKIVGFIYGIYVRELYRRRGTGTRLVEELCKFFRAENVEEVNLRYVLDNREGEEFWKALGFKPVIHTANTSLQTLESRLQSRYQQGNGGKVFQRA